MKFKLSHENYPEDVTRIRTAIVNRGYKCSRKQAKKVWEEYSDSMSAGWLILPDAESTIWACIEPFIVMDDYAV